MILINAIYCSFRSPNNRNNINTGLKTTKQFPLITRLKLADRRSVNRQRQSNIYDASHVYVLIKRTSKKDVAIEVNKARNYRTISGFVASKHTRFINAGKKVWGNLN